MPFAASCAVVGSSPHTRGALSTAPTTHRTPGIIPAYAGSTRMTRPRARASRDHPRIRGEHYAACATLEISSGIIPAYAGSTFCLLLVLGRCRDHPRIRGEHISPLTLVLFSPGSSPHTRGAPEEGEPSIKALGIIPAYAGSTAVHSRSASALRDHPRIRGEHRS